MKMIRNALLFVFLLSLSCSSTIYLPRSNESRLVLFDEIIILQNDYSYIIPSRKQPGHNEIRYMVKDTVPAIEPSSSIIKKELRQHGYSCTIWDSVPEPDNTAIYLSYQDYWKRDVKKYMHLMVISVFNSQDELIYKVVSHSHPKGFHNYPTPGKQLPLMIDELSKHLKTAYLAKNSR